MTRSSGGGCGQPEAGTRRGTRVHFRPWKRTPPRGRVAETAPPPPDLRAAGNAPGARRTVRESAGRAQRVRVCALGWCTPACSEYCNAPCAHLGVCRLFRLGRVTGEAPRNLAVVPPSARRGLLAVIGRPLCRRDGQKTKTGLRVAPTGPASVPSTTATTGGAKPRHNTGGSVARGCGMVTKLIPNTAKRVTVLGRTRQFN